VIVGELRNGSPFVRAIVRVPRLSARAQIDFLVDTGASHTLISPIDATKLGVTALSFAAVRATPMSGVGGRSLQYAEPCLVDLVHVDGHTERIEPLLNFASPDTDADYPSLLGRDLIGLYKLTYHLAENLVSLE
jgi:hypothetical protein